MPKNPGQKKKLTALLFYLYRATDETHGVTVEQIVSALAEEGIGAERKSVYDDFLALSELGIEVEKCGTRPERYKLAERLFDLSELKMLVDAVEVSRFITPADAGELVAKLKGLAGPSARRLSRHVFLPDRARTANTGVMDTVDRIHQAIDEGVTLSFLYFDYDLNKKKVYHGGGKTYRVTPECLVRNNEYYYLAAYDPDAGVTKSFRVDKMDKVAICKEKSAEIPKEQQIDTEKLPLKIFGMYHGEEELVTLLCDNRLAGVILDRFGSEPTLFPVGKEKFRVSVRVIVSKNFFGWLSEFGGDVVVEAPAAVRGAYRDHLTAILHAHEN